MACLISGIGFPVSLVFALPQDGNIIGGQGSINQPTAQDLVVNQNSNNLIINWQSFNIGASESVRFIQPGINSVALNRVTGIDPSIIAGRLSANGQVFITNSSGVIFLPGSQVDVHGLLATTLDITDQDFLDRNYRFFQNPSRSLASILNEGTINASYVSLLAPSVVNRGTIVASLGSVALASGKAATLDFIGDDLINFAITEEVEGTATDAGGNVLDHNISNEGLIRADGGVVTLSVRRAGEIIKSVINQGGVIEARSVVNKNGRILLFGGDNGIVSVTGTLDASGKGAGEKGGTIHVTGENVGLFESAKLDASGDAGGGEVLVGGDRLGEGELQNAKATFVDEEVSISADAITNGDGGKIIVFAEDSAKIFGDLSARGGSLSGNGGFIETSGKQYFEIFKTPDIGAPNGQGGKWLIDPFNITIVAGSALSNITTTSPFTSLGNSAVLGVDLILGGLAQGSVTIVTGNGGSQPGDIIWGATLDYNNSTNNSILELDAIGSIFFNKPIFDSSPGGDQLILIAKAGTLIDINENITSQGKIIFDAPAVNLNTTNILSNNNPITFITDNLGSSDSFLVSTVNSGGAFFTLLPFTPSNGLDLGTGPGILGPGVNPPDTFIKAGLLVFGDSNTGPITVNDFSIGFTDVIINSGSTVTFTGAPSIFKKLSVNAASGVSNTNGSIFNNEILTLQNSTNLLQGENVGTFAIEFLQVGGPPPPPPTKRRMLIPISGFHTPPRNAGRRCGADVCFAHGPRDP